MDVRGTGFRGDEFKQQTYKQLGMLEAQDVLAAVKYFKEFAPTIPLTTPNTNSPSPLPSPLSVPLSPLPSPLLFPTETKTSKFEKFVFGDGHMEGF